MLIAPEAVVGVDVPEKAVSVDLTQHQIEEAPEIAADLPVSRQMEAALRRRFGWPEYWDAGAMGGIAAPPVFPPFAPEEPSDAEVGGEPADGDPNLRSVREITGYALSSGPNGESVGDVDDLIVDDDGWVVRYLIVDTGGWLSDRPILVAPVWCEAIDWSSREIRVPLSRESIETSPVYDPEKPIDRAYEAEMHRHYARDFYWSD